MNDNATILKEIITHRRTIKPGQMNGGQLANEQVAQLLELADWAPTHAHTEPWRFWVYAGIDKVKEFCAAHADLYQKESGDNYNPATADKLLHMGDHASHLILAGMQRGPLVKIPILEEIAATAAAIQNLLLGAESMGIAAYWGSGGMILKPAMKTFLGLGEDDVMLGALYLGQSDVKKAGQRNVPLAEKVKWM